MHRQRAVRTHLKLSALVALSAALSAGCQFTIGPLEEEDAPTEGTTGSATSTTTPAATTAPVPPVPTTEPEAGGSTTSADESSETVGGSSTGPVPDPDDCCAPHPAIGCTDAKVEACVCELDRFCCEEEWDAECVAKVDAFGCGECDPNFDAGDCCTPNGTPGCDDPVQTECLCALDEFCCATEWDHVCVDLLSESGCGDCSATEQCCQAQPGPGCGSPGVEECVCASRPECCEQGWDAACAEAVELLECGFCPYADTESCCEPHYGGGCETRAVEECVCAKDQYCCEVQWDETCVDEIEPFGCGPCEGGTNTGSGDSTGS